MDVPVQIAVLAITVAEGSGFTVIVTESDFAQPLELVSVRIYVVVMVGLTEGLATVEVNPVGLLVHK